MKIYEKCDQITFDRWKIELIFFFR